MGNGTYSLWFFDRTTPLLLTYRLFFVTELLFTVHGAGDFPLPLSPFLDEPRGHGYSLYCGSSKCIVAGTSYIYF